MNRFTRLLTCVAFIYQMGACPCGCLAENYWFQGWLGLSGVTRALLQQESVAIDTPHERTVHLACHPTELAPNQCQQNRVFAGTAHRDAHFLSHSVDHEAPDHEAPDHCDEWPETFYVTNPISLFATGSELQFAVPLENRLIPLGIGELHAGHAFSLVAEFVRAPLRADINVYRL